MFIVVRFGYRMKKYYAIDCLGASLSDNMISECIEDIMKMLSTKELTWNKEIVERTKKVQLIDKRILEIDTKIKTANPVVLCSF